MSKSERVASLSTEAQTLCRTPGDGERPEDKLIEMLVEIAKGTRYWEDVEAAVNAYETLRSDDSGESQLLDRRRKLPWRV